MIKSYRDAAVRQANFERRQRRRGEEEEIPWDAGEPDNKME